MAPEEIHDSSWPEVKLLNGCARLIGFLQLGERGFGVLVFTWTTVVLLGGFVSDLQKKDFWCLTLITLIQTFHAGVFDYLIKDDESSNPWSFLTGLLVCILTMAKDTFIAIKAEERKTYCHIMLEKVIMVVQLLVLVLLCPLVVVFFLGLFISTGISLWRLIEHDYGNASGGANQMPALDVLYSLAVAQGVLLSYRIMYIFIRDGLVSDVAKSYSVDESLVEDYFFKIRKECRKNPMRSVGKNLITYAVDLLSNDNYHHGVQFIGGVLQKRFSDGNGTLEDQAVLVKQKLTQPALFGHIIWRLIDTMCTGSDDCIREHAARIVAHVAASINLRFSTKGSQFLSFLLSTVEDYNAHPRKHPRTKVPQIEKLRGRLPSGSHWLVEQGLRIIKNLADNVDNRRIIIDTAGVTSKISAPLISEPLHRDHHDVWSSIAKLSVELMTQLTEDTGDTGKRFRTKILSNYKKIVICTLRRIIKCHKCELSLKIQAVKIFLQHLDKDTKPSVMASGKNLNTEGLISKISEPLISEELHRDKHDVWSRKAELPLELMTNLTEDTGETGEKFRRKVLSNHKEKVVGTLQRIINCLKCELSVKIQAAEIFLQYLDEDTQRSVMESESSSNSHFFGILLILLLRTKSSEELGNLAYKDLSVMLPQETEGTATSSTRDCRRVVEDLARADVDNNISIRQQAAKLILELLMHHIEQDDEYLEVLKNAMLQVIPMVLTEILDCGSTREGKQTTGPSNERSSLGDIESCPVNQVNKLQKDLLSLCKELMEKVYKKDKDVARRLDKIAEEICNDQEKRPMPFCRLVAEAEKPFQRGGRK